MRRSRNLRVLVLLTCASMAHAAVVQRGGGPGQRGGGAGPIAVGRGGRGETLPALGGLREDTLRVTDKVRPMLEMVELLQKRTGRPISYEDPVWVFEGFKERQPNGQTVTRAAEVIRIPGFAIPKPGSPSAKPEDLVSLVRGSFETRITVDARTHLLPEPVDIALQGIFDRVLADYASRQLPGSFIAGNLGEFGWVVLPQSFRDKQGVSIQPGRLLDFQISFPAATRSVEATLDLIVQAVQKGTRQRVELKHVASEGTVGVQGTVLEPLKIPRGQTVLIGANNEPARRVIANMLRAIDRGNARTHPPIPQRAWRLLYHYDKQAYTLDFVDVRQELYDANGQPAGSKPVTWQAPPPPVATSFAPGLAPLSLSAIVPTGSPVPPFVESPVGPFGRLATPIAVPSAPVVGAVSTPLVPNGVLLANGAIVDRAQAAGPGAAASSRPNPVGSDPKSLVEHACSGCHDYTLVSAKRAARDEWDALVRSMVDKGAALKTDEIGAAVDYLARTYPVR